jgi:hypothetical protein
MAWYVVKHKDKFTFNLIIKLVLKSYLKGVFLNMYRMKYSLDNRYGIH